MNILTMENNSQDNRKDQVLCEGGVKDERVNATGSVVTSGSAITR